MPGMIAEEQLAPPCGATLIRLAHADRSCFAVGTPILMADGGTRPIEAVRPGDMVLGRRGCAHRVVACLRARLGSRRLYSLNGGPPFVTAEHPFLTTEGWKALDPQATRCEPGLAPKALRLGDRLCRAGCRPGRGTGFVFVQNTVELVSIEAVEADPGTLLFDLALGGEHGYVADGWIACDQGAVEAVIRSGSGRR